MKRFTRLEKDILNNSDQNEFMLSSMDSFLRDKNTPYNEEL